jgi:hypothetical protein
MSSAKRGLRGHIVFSRRNPGITTPPYPAIYTRTVRLHHSHTTLTITGTMLIKEFHKDLPTASGGTMRVFFFHPSIPNHPHARFPGVVIFSEIYQVTGPVARFARQIAGQGYICAAPSSWHEFESPAPLAYDGPGTDRGNELKITKAGIPALSLSMGLMGGLDSRRL